MGEGEGEGEGELGNTLGGSGFATTEGEITGEGTAGLAAAATEPALSVFAGATTEP